MSQDAVLRLFVYGTLAPGRRNHHVVSDIPGDWEVASMCGDLVDEGWGAAMGCPAIVPRADGPAVEGFVFRSPDLDAHWPRLDAFEGEAYERTTVVVTLGSGEQVEAQVYALRDTGR